MVGFTVIAESPHVLPEYALIVSEKGGAERRLPFRGNELTVGRVAGNDIVLPKGNVSKRHARILFREGRFIVTDLNSTNGTYVNRQRIEQATIVREEDRIFIGDFVIRVEPSTGEGASEPLTPRREFEAPIPTLAPEGAELHTAHFSLQHASTGHHSSTPPWERSVTGEDSSARSSGPPPRLSESPPPEPSNASQRLADISLGQRRAVARVIGAIVDRKGPPPVEPDDRYADEIRELGSQIVDQLLVDGQVPIGTSAEAVLDQVQLELLDLGPLRELLGDAQVTTISIPKYDEIVETREGRQQVFPPGFSRPESLELALSRLARRSGVELDQGAISRFGLRDGARVSVVRGALTPSGPLVVIEKPRRVTSTFDDLVRRGAISRAMATFLSHAVQARLNLLVVGGKEEGVQSLLGALAEVARERIVAATDFDQYLVDSDSVVRLDLAQARGRARELFGVVSSIPGARLLVTLSSPDVTSATLEALGGGLSGVLGTVEASSLKRALLGLPTEALRAGSGGTFESYTRAVLGGFDLAIEVARLRDGRVRVLRIAELASDGHGGIEIHDIFRFTVARVAAGGAVEGNFAPSGQIPEVLGQLQTLGLKLETSLFSRPPSK